MASATQKLDKREDRKEYYAAQAKAREKSWGYGYMLGGKASAVAAVFAWRWVTPFLAPPLVAMSIYLWYLAIRDFREHRRLLRSLRLR